MDEYFGSGEAMKLMETVNILWAVTHNHMTERATSGPYMYEPYEFDNVLGIETLPGSDSCTRVWYDAVRNSTRVAQLHKVKRPH